MLTINTYAAQGPHAADLVFGPRHIARWYNMAPHIADLLTDDIAAVNARKHRIAEAEWARAEVSAEDYLRHTGGRVRDGRAIAGVAFRDLSWRPFAGHTGQAMNRR